ncbi:MAG: efflux RND transporter periplasmic adaptor subunit, partial [Deltaproteobacteria bacterium]|nr:efflux RND transporter periplasmic adaptor subunit [Deltaproteobacteria bacterium]
AGDERPGYVGVLAPRDLSEVLAPFTSTIAALDVRLGDAVAKGQKLGRLDDRPLREERAILGAALRTSQAEVAQAEVERRAAGAVYAREQDAFAKGISSGAELSAAEFNDKKAQMTVARAAAAVEEHRAKIAKLDARLTDTTLTAPLAGRVSLIYARDGERVGEGAPVVRVISSDELYIKFAIPADRAGTVAAGDEVDVVVDGPPEVRTRAIVRHVAPELDAVAQMILADAELVSGPNAAKLQGGLVCRILPMRGAGK